MSYVKEFQDTFAHLDDPAGRDDQPCGLVRREKSVQAQLFSKPPPDLSKRKRQSHNRRDGIRETKIVHDLLQAAMATSDNKYQYFADGLDGFPVFGFRPGSEVKQPYRLYLPEKLPAEFDLVATFKPMSVETSYLFAVLNPFETVVQLGIRISNGSASNQNISLVYTNSDEHTHSEEVAKFTVPKLSKKWSKIVMRVSTTEVILYLNCHEMARHRVTRIPQELVFDTASTLYIAQAGPHIQEKYDGLLQSLKLYPGHPQDLVRCTTGFESFPVEYGSGDDDTSALEDTSGFIDFDQFGREDNDHLDKDDEVNPPPFITPPPPNSIAKGAKGEKGDKGESVRGPPGPPGPPGTAVYDPIEAHRTAGSGDERNRAGAKGEPGSCTCNATDLLATFTMPKMIQGPKGDPGLPGKEGKQGQMGLTGAAGPPGERGRPGATGPKGDQGNVGSPGPEGPQGQKGTPGRDGIPGEKGAHGPPGPPGKSEFSVHDDGMTMRPGLPGQKGEPGIDGNTGSKGEPGIPGDKGEKGEFGSKGSRGEAGKDGPRGIQGFKGEPGVPGIAGIAGTPGENGRPAEKGSKGDTGPEGKPGSPGPPGPVATALVGQLASSRNGTSATKGDKGDSGARGYRGEVGPKGEKGERGESGVAGVPGVNGVQGPLGDKGEPGRDGTPGLSGVKGTKGDRGERGPAGETVFAGSGDYIAIKGEKGTEGKRGRRGRPGPIGLTGPPGKPGIKGETGPPGWMGGPGSRGMPGNPGTSGLKGEKGEPCDVGSLGEGLWLKGDKGADGFAGIPGQPGRDGQRGPAGPPGPPGLPSQGNYVPVPGPPGPPGNPGSPGLSLVGQPGEPGIGRSRIFEERDYYPSRQGSGGASGLPGSRTISETSTRIVPGAVTFQNTEAMTKMSGVSPVGTLAYIIDEEALLVRVNNGWQYIALGSLLPITTPTPPTTLPPPANPPFESSNLINQIPMKADGTGLRMAALNEPTTGDTHGVRGADYACYRQAKRAGLRGTFRAFLSSRVQNVDSIVRLGDRDLPIVNIKGDVLFNSWKDMFDGKGAYFSQNPRIYSFNGKNILTDFGWPEKIVWHGSHKMGDRAMETYCDAWHSGGTDRYGLASPLNGGRLLEQVRFSCNKRFALLCIEVASETALRRKRSAREETDESFADLTVDDYAEHLEGLMAR